MKIALLLLTCLPAIAAAQAKTPTERVDAFLKTARKKMRIPGLAFAVVKDGKIVQQGALGDSNLSYPVHAEVDTSFLIASVTKQFTSAAIMKLVEEGKVRLDASITEYIPDSPETWKPITVRHALTHTAGFKNRFEDTDVSQWKLNYPKEKMLASSKATPLESKPGEKWLYSDQGYFLLGIVIENVSGKSYRDYLRDTFFAPLGMSASTTLSLDEIVPKLAQGYRLQGGRHYNNNRRSEYGMTSHFGVVSTVEDLAKWSIALDEGKVVRPESLAQMWTAAKLADGTTPMAGTSKYGFGWFLDRFNGHQIVEHGGSTGTELYKLPGDKLTVVVLTNLEQITGGDAGYLARSIAKIYVPDLAWNALKPIELADKALAKRVEEDLTRMLAGEIDPANYDPSFEKPMRAALASQKDALKGFGTPKSIQLVRNDTLEETQTLGYRMTFESTTFFATVKLNKAQKITYLGLEPEDLP